MSSSLRRASGSRRARVGALRAFPVPAAERLEDRTLLTGYIVNTLDDIVAADGFVSLREAIQAANTNAAVNEAAAGSPGSAGGAITPDFINFAAGLAGTIRLAGGQLDITDRLGIYGPGASRLAVSGNGGSRVFSVAAFRPASIFDLTITGGRAADGDGGGIHNLGSLLLNGCTVSGNESLSSGGGIHNGGALTLANCTISSNSSYVSGGGISTFGSLSSLDLSKTTVAGNSALGFGGGIYADRTLAVTNSTISSNAARYSGGGIYVAANATATLQSVTVVNNVADSDADAGGFGGGIAVEGGGTGSVTLYGTLVAGNSRLLRVSPFPLADDDDVRGTLAAGSSSNLVGDAGTAGGLSNGVNGNIIGVGWETVFDPVLRDNGGPTLTHKLLIGSPAINAGTSREIIGPTDQRGGGFSRVLQGRLDIGAYEMAPAADLVGFLNGGWWVGVTDGTKFTTTLWASWSNVAWDAVGQADFNNDSRSDVYGLLDGSWWVALSTGTAYAAATRWAGWSNLDWQGVRTADLNNDGRADILARLGGQWWAALSNGTAFGAPRLWASWPALDWREFFTADLNADGRADLLGFAHGQWWAGLSTGIGFDGPKVLSSWSDAAWQTLFVLDADGDRKSDVVGLLNGSWWVGRNSGTAFSTTRWAAWSNVAWADPLVGDFDGDGTSDIAARYNGGWWVALSTGGGFAAAKPWAGWSNVAWQDVRVGDFDGNGRDDITGRFNGQWWVAGSTGASFVTSLWGTWSDVAWRAVAVVDATGHVASASASGGAFASSPSALQNPSFALRVTDEERLRLFWSKAREDDEFAGRLIAG